MLHLLAMLKYQGGKYSWTTRSLYILSQKNPVAVIADARELIWRCTGLKFESRKDTRTGPELGVKDAQYMAWDYAASINVTRQVSQMMERNAATHWPRKCGDCIPPLCTYMYLVHFKLPLDVRVLIYPPDTGKMLATLRVANLSA